MSESEISQRRSAKSRAAPRRHFGLGLTRSGYVALVLGCVGVAASVVTKITEYMILGLSLIVIIVAARVLLAVGRLDVGVQRSISPRRLTVGEDCTVRLRFTRTRVHRTFVIDATDRLDGLKIGLPTIPVSGSDEPTTRSYQIHAGHRGLSLFGPLTVSRTDPFGVARISGTIGSPVEVIVLPRVEQLDVSNIKPASELSGGVQQHRIIATVSEEFDALREYVPGDDVRRVHWASTARFGRPMVRNHQQPWHHRATVVLDTRRQAYGNDSEGFERAVVAAASALVSFHLSGSAVRLVTAEGHDTGYLDGAQEVDATLDILATIALIDTTELIAVLDGARSQSDDAQTIVCTGYLSPAEQGALLSTANVELRPIAVRCTEPTATDQSNASLESNHLAMSVPTVVFGPNTRLSVAWDSATVNTSAPLGTAAT